jgi:hypothetical protein
MNLVKNIRYLRVYAVVLFILPILALIGSILFHNYLVSYNYSYQEVHNFKQTSSGNLVKYLCNEKNDYCKKLFFETHDTLDQCAPNNIIKYYESAKGKNIKELGEIYFDGDEKKVRKRINLKDLYDPKQYEKVFSDKIKKKYPQIYEVFELTENKSEDCILNSVEYKFYKIFPFFYEKIAKLKLEGIELGTSKKISPFFKGDTSISNIVKRFPINYLFKSLIYLSIIAMICYWVYYNKIFRLFDNTKKSFYFFKFGILSAIFLFLHTFFLGSTFENEILTKLRKFYIIFFILFEVLAQAFLIRKILSLKEKIKPYTKSFIIYSKLIFVILICVVTFIVLLILITYNLDSKVDYILEWNYFSVLLFYYLLSFLMWKKSN